MSAKTIAVWGSPGCGKGLVAVSLAHWFNKRKKSAIVISCDRTTPMFSCYMPFNRFDEKQSLGVLLNNSVDAQGLKNKLHINGQIKDTAFLSFGIGDDMQKYPMLQSFKLEALLTILSEYTDYIICDLTANFLIEKSTMISLQYCDAVIKLITPDNAGIAFLETYFPLVEKEESSQLHIKAVSNAYEYSPYKTIMKERNIEYIFPHSKELYLSFLSGDLLTNANDEHAKTFFENLANIAERIEQHVRTNL